MVDRIKQVMEFSGLTPAQFATEIGINRSGLTHLFSGRNQPSLDLVKKILVTFPQIKTEWLMMGMGSMLKDDTEIVKESIKPVQVMEPDLFTTMDTNTIEEKKSVVSVEANETINVPPKETSSYNIPTRPIENNQREVKNQPPYSGIDQIFDSGAAKKVKKIVLLFEDNSFEIYNPINTK
ncbi:MAG TPA: helix-turn-helix transcriptional regulator [Bacteroidales bacterium]|nr:helix-turn-helix transcriptional regulator [Bacteroidales bacterium]